jgi:collagen type VI alpha
VDFNLLNYTRTTDVQSAVSKVRYGGYSANQHLALQLARTDVFTQVNGARLADATVTKLAIVITDNPSVNRSATQAEAERLRAAGVGIVTVGVGTYLDRYELSAVASYPYSRNMFTVNTVRNLSAVMDSVKRIICGGQSSCHNSYKPACVIQRRKQKTI